MFRDYADYHLQAKFRNLGIRRIYTPLCTMSVFCSADVAS